MNARWVRSSGVVGLLLVLSSVGASAAPPTPAQREAVTELSVALTRAGNLFREGKYKESADVVKDVQAKADKIAEAGKDVVPLLTPLYSKLERAHALLELEGFELPPLKKPGEGAPPGKTEPGKPEPGKPTGDISFVMHVAPILMTKCGRCHVNDAKGMFSISDFATLMKGPPGGKVVFAMDSVGSRLIEVIESGDMPRGGVKVTPDELTILKKWIDTGAKFDGKSEQDALASLVPGAKPAEAPMVAVTEATGKETISFAKDIAPVLASTCTTCHGTNRPRENFSLFTFTALLKGGDAGPPIVPGKPAESLLIKKLKGTADGQRMPQGKDPLADAVIAKFEKWIEEGAKFDGGEPGQSIAVVAALARARGATHEQLSADRAKLAGDNWRLGMPGIKAAQSESQNFLVLGNVGENTLADIGQRAESVAPKVATILKATPDSPLIKGRMTLFVFGGRYDYSEFGQMVEQRQIPKEWRGHWMFNVVDAYGALVVPRDGEFSLEVLVGQELAGAYLASLGKTPRWFAEGCARAVAAKLDPADARVVQWNEQVADALAAMSSPDDSITGKLPPELADVANYSFASFLMSDGKRFPKLLDALRAGEAFDKAFPAVYGGSPGQVAQAWVKRPPKATKPGKAASKAAATK